MGWRALVAVIALGVPAVACGLSLVGQSEETSAPEDAPKDASTEPSPPTTLDAGHERPSLPDASEPEDCASACGDAGTCVDGWCQIDCAGNKACPGVIACPPGVPCRVKCSGKDTCLGGVDCARATRCQIACEGEDACEEGVRCSGESCEVSCVGEDACQRGVACDAGTCSVSVSKCKGEDGCLGRVECYADECTVECGAPGGGDEGRCANSITCEANERCRVTCRDALQCGVVRATAGKKVDVNCEGTCRELHVAAAEADVTCLEDACPNGIRCDGGVCKATCEDKSTTLCCSASAQCVGDSCNKNCNAN